jgi:hypothetical protein
VESPSDPSNASLEQLRKHMRQLIDSTRARIAEAQRLIRVAQDITRRKDPSEPTERPRNT